MSVNPHFEKANTFNLLKKSSYFIKHTSLLRKVCLRMSQIGARAIVISGIYSSYWTQADCATAWPWTLSLSNTHSRSNTQTHIHTHTHKHTHSDIARERQTDKQTNRHTHTRHSHTRTHARRLESSKKFPYMEKDVKEKMSRLGSYHLRLMVQGPNSQTILSKLS